MWNFGTGFAIIAVVMMSVVCILSGYVAYASIKNMVNLIFYLVFSLIYFVFLFAVKHLCGNHSLDPLLCTTSAFVRLANCQAQISGHIGNCLSLWCVLMSHFISVFVFIIE